MVQQKIIYSILIILIILFSSFSGCIRSKDNIPIQYRHLYDQLEEKLVSLHYKLDNVWDHQRGDVVFTTELLVASANRGDMILEPEVFQAVVFNLDAMKSLGVTGVSLDIKYPVLVEGFPRQDEYLSFYRNVVDEIRERNLILLIAVQVAFVDPVFGNPDMIHYYDNLTLEQYKIEKRQMVETVINEFHPEYLTIENEPQTQEMNTGLNFSVDHFIDIVHFILNDLEREQVKIGAGAGTWEDSSYVQRLARETTIDYLDIHIYPIQGNLVLDTMEDIKSIADENNKSLVIGETWLYKCEINEISQSHYLTVIARDVFSFWAPLDESFLRLMINLSYYLEVEVVNPFWMQYFWGYLPHSLVTESMNMNQRFDTLGKITAQNMATGNLTIVGETYKEMIQV